MLSPEFDEYDENFISIIQDWSLRKGGELPLYHVENMIGKSDKQEFLKPAIHIIFFGECGFLLFTEKYTV